MSPLAKAVARELERITPGVKFTVTYKNGGAL